MTRLNMGRANHTRGPSRCASHPKLTESVGGDWVCVCSSTATLHEVARADHIDAVFDLKWAPAEHSAALAGDVDGGSPAAMLAMAGTACEVSLHRCTADSMQCVAQVQHAPLPTHTHRGPVLLQQRLFWRRRRHCR